MTPSLPAGLHFTLWNLQNEGLKVNSSRPGIWTAEEMGLELMNAQSYTYFWPPYSELEEASAIQGFVLYRYGSAEVEIMHLAVREKGQGKGAQMFREFLEHQKNHRQLLSSILLEVSEKNEAAKRLYLSLGFEVVGHRPAYYRNGDAALLMTLRF